MSAPAADEFVLVDTNVVSFCFKGDTRTILYQPRLVGRLQVIAAQTRAELELWSLARNWGLSRRAALHAYLKDFVLLEADEPVCVRWAEVQNNAQRRGHPLSVSDAWIAATALVHFLPLVTHNPDDFRYVPGLTVITEK